MYSTLLSIFTVLKALVVHWLNCAWLSSNSNRSRTAALGQLDSIKTSKCPLHSMGSITVQPRDNITKALRILQYYTMKEKQRLNKHGTIYHWFSRLWKRFTREQWRLVNERDDLHTTEAPRGKKKTFHSMTKTNIETILMASRGGSRCVCLQCQSNGCAILFGLLQVDCCWYVWLRRAFCYHFNFP